jgi:hypothetical protein
MKRNLLIAGAVFSLVIVAVIAVAWANCRQERIQPKTIPELVERLKGAYPGLCFVPASASTGDLAGGVYVADRPITWTEAIQMRRCDDPEHWRGVALVRTNTPTTIEYDFGGSQSTWQSRSFFVVGDSTLIQTICRCAGS